MIQPSNAFLLAVLGASKLATGPLETGQLELYKSGPVTSGNMQLSDFVICDYDGYAPKPVAAADWGTAFMEDGVNPCLRAKLVTFQPTGTTTPNVALGWLLRDAAGVNVLLASAFKEPVSMNGPASRCDVIPQYNLKPTSDYGTAADV